MVSQGWDVILSTGGVQISDSNVNADGIKILDVNVDRHKFNLKTDIGLIGSYLKHLKSEKPDVIHAITIKPILFMGIALLLNKLMRRQSPKLVLTYPGLGKVFEPQTNIKTRIRKFVVSRALKFSNSILKPHATFENYSSMEELAKEKIITKENSSVVMGAGLDHSKFYSSKRKGGLVVLFASRLLNAKGLAEFIEAAKNLKVEFPKVDFQIAGKQEIDNPDCFSIPDLMSAHNKGDINYAGSLAPDQMPELLRKADIHVAPSKLQEGLPRVVLEAASCGCCLIASDHEMLRRFIIEGKTGWLLKEVSAEALEKVLRIALSNPAKTRKMGVLVAKKAEVLPIYEDNIISHFLEIYQK